MQVGYLTHFYLVGGEIHTSSTPPPVKKKRTRIVNDTGRFSGSNCAETKTNFHLSLESSPIVQSVVVTSPSCPAVSIIPATTKLQRTSSHSPSTCIMWHFVLILVSFPRKIECVYVKETVPFLSGLIRRSCKNAHTKLQTVFHTMPSTGGIVNYWAPWLGRKGHAKASSALYQAALLSSCS